MNKENHLLSFFFQHSRQMMHNREEFTLNETVIINETDEKVKELI